MKSPRGGGQTRSFTYDSLARVFAATNPELGSNALSYVHEENGNLVNRLSSGSPGLLTSYTYDSLNRLQTLD